MPARIAAAFTLKKRLGLPLATAARVSGTPECVVLSWLRKSCGVLRTSLFAASPLRSKAGKKISTQNPRR